MKERRVLHKAVSLLLLSSVHSSTFEIGDTPSGGSILQKLQFLAELFACLSLWQTLLNIQSDRCWPLIVPCFFDSMSRHLTMSYSETLFAARLISPPARRDGWNIIPLVKTPRDGQIRRKYCRLLFVLFHLNPSLLSAHCSCFLTQYEQGLSLWIINTLMMWI
jgi:hypothetical protein